MVKIKFLGPINQKDLELDIKNLQELKEQLKIHNIDNKWLELCALALNDEILTDKNIEFKNGDTLALLPPVSGG